MNIKKHDNKQDNKACTISGTLATTLSGIAARLPKSEDAFSTFNSIRITGHFQQMKGAAWLHPAGAEDESALKKWKLLEEGNDKTVEYPDAVAMAIQQVDHGLCLVPSLNGGWALRPAKKFNEDDVIMRIDGDWKKKKPETNSDRDCVYWREDFTRASLGRICARYWLCGKVSRDLWPHVGIAGEGQTPTLVVVRDYNGQGLKLVAAMDLDAWGSELTVQMIVDAPLTSPLALTPETREPNSRETIPSVEAIVATDTDQAAEESGGHKDTSNLSEEHIRQDGEKDAKESSSSDSESDKEPDEDEDVESESGDDASTLRAEGGGEEDNKLLAQFLTHEEFDFKCEVTDFSPGGQR